MKRWTKWCVSLAAAAAVALVPSGASAQDFPTFKGNNGRVGRNAAPALSGPGRSFLRWWRPNLADNIGVSTLIDNQGPGTSSSGTWFQPLGVGDEAFNAFLSDPDADPAIVPPYRYTITTNSFSNVDPTVPANPLALSTWTWTVSPSDLTPRNYALYVWLPIGPTRNAIGFLQYPQRYFVYEILYGNGQRWIDVVDTFAAGTGWIRLGNGGRPSTQLYNYNGVNPILIRLYNTVPRDANNNLTDREIDTLVYADAALAVPDYGTYRASPIVSEFPPGGPLNTHVVAAVNKYELGTVNGQPATITIGEVMSLEYDSVSGANNTRWTMRPASESADTVVYQDNASAGVTVGLGWTAQTVPTGFRGTNYLSNPIVIVPGTETDVIYAPTLDDGSYEVWAWLQGSSGGTNFGTAVQVEILEGVNVTTLTVNQDPGGGWTRLGAVRFNHNNAMGEPLRVRITNLSTNPGDIGRLAYADMLRFIGAADTAIHSTPVQVTARVRPDTVNPPVDTPVTLVAAENGTIYCLSSANGDILWTYPSTPDPDNPGWTDPNQVAGEDGSGPIAEMPIGFDLSSALVQRLGGEDYLFIGTTNGRVYCIEMAGRGDMDLTRRVPGTTRRRFTYPDDYPANVRTSLLGPMTGSVAYASTPFGQDTIYVPTRQGRLYALDAVGNPGNKTTNVRWTFPPLTSPTIGSIVTTPVCDFGRVYFGTMAPDGGVGQFYALDQDTGAIVWSFSGTGLWGGILASHFVSSPVTIPSGQMAGMPNTIVVANDNGWITALNADTGVPLWATDELGSNVTGGLTYTPMTVFDNLGGLFAVPEPCVVVPTNDGRLAALFAETPQTNIFGGNNRLAWGFDTNSGGMTATPAVGRNWMYMADHAGYVYGFNDTPGAISPGNPPGQQVIVPNDPAGIPFREAEVKFVTAATYQALRLPTGAAGHLTYAQGNDPTRHLPDDRAFEWGETMYIMMYKFPYDLAANPSPPGQPPQIEFRINVEGVSVRNISVRAKRFTGGGPVSGTSGEELDGYAVISFTVQGSGSTAIPPGSGKLTAAISAQFAPGARLQSVVTDPALTQRRFRVANPISVAVGFDAAGQPLTNFSIAYTRVASDPEALVNGSPDVPATIKREDLMLASVGYVGHAQKGVKSIAWIDRSLMLLLRGPDRGLDQVRAERSDLTWQGGLPAVQKPLDPLAFPSYEDTPTNFPNDSLDYPNMRRERIAIVKDRFGFVENPVFSPITLKPPLPDPSGPFDPATRILQLTPVDIEVSVPRFQPANNSPATNSMLGQEPGGYYGRLNVWVDSTGNSQLDRVGRREAFRSINLGAGVPRDERIAVGTPTVDLGSLGHGTGFDPGAFPGPWQQPGSPYSPWTAPGSYSDLFKPFTVFNLGNVNMRQMRIAKMVNEGGVNIYPWGLFAPANHERSWLDTQFNLWSDIDATFAPPNPNVANYNRVILQKARVDDRAPTELTTNPRRRVNPNLNVFTESFLIPGLTPAPPRVSATIPIGFPVGSYVTTMRVIEDYDNDEALRYTILPGNVLQPAEPFSDPTFTLKFNVRESRLTNTFTRYTAPMVHDLTNGTETFLHQHAQPAAMRDPDGNLVLAYTSTSSAFNAAQPGTESLNDQWRLYLVSLNGVRPDSGSALGQSHLPELNVWAPGGGGRFYRQEVGPFPTTSPDVLFQSQAGESVLAPTVKFGAPVMPLLGAFNPYSGAVHSQNYLAFLGEAQIQTPSGRRGVSRPFVVAYTVAPDGSISVQTPHGLPTAEGGVKARPALVVTSSSTGTVLFGAGGSGQTQIYYVSYELGGLGSYTDGALFQLPVGPGFESAGSPSVHARVYDGVASPGLSNGDRIFEMTFTGKLRGRPSSEIFFARLLAGGPMGGPRSASGGLGPILRLPQRTDERLTAEAEAGVYRALGVGWNLNATVQLDQVLNGVRTALEVPGTRVIDRQTNILSFDTRLGGKAYLDPNLGTVRMVGAIPSRSAVLLLTYTPRILRVSGGVGAGYTGSTAMFDNRMIGEFGYWARSNNTSLVPPGGPIPSDEVRSARYLFTYGRSAAGAGQASRPYLRTFRLGVQLPAPIHTQANGNVTAFTVTGMAATPTSFYQVDPANGRAYFTSENENRTVQVTYTGVDETTGLPIVGIQVEAQVTMILERDESPLAIEQALNESQVTAFYDPFDDPDAADRRPGLIWLFWTSTRAGTPDLYYETIAPRFTPVILGRG